MANETQGDRERSKLAIMVRSAGNLPEASWSDERIAAIRSTCCPEKATNAQLAIFLATANKYGLDPLVKEIWLVEQSGRVMVVVGRDAYVKVAGREPSFRGYRSGVVYAKDTFSIEGEGDSVIVRHKVTGFDRGVIQGAFCVLNVEGRPPVVILRTWAQFKHLHSKDSWSKYPDDMLETRCIVAALKRAYNLAGIEEEDVARDVLAGRDPMLAPSGQAEEETKTMANALRARLTAPKDGPYTDSPEVLDVTETGAEEAPEVSDEQLRAEELALLEREAAEEGSAHE